RLLYHWTADLPPRTRDVQTGGRPLTLLGEGRPSGMPPSRHASGGLYAWAGGSGDTGLTLADAPAWVVALMLRRDVPPPPAASRDGKGGVCGTGSLPWEEKAGRYLRACEPAIIKHGGDEKLLKVMQYLFRRFDPPEDVAFRLLLDEYNPRCRPPWPEARL